MRGREGFVGEIGTRAGRIEDGCGRGDWAKGRGSAAGSTDIYPRPCVTGSAKSAVMNVLAGINPQCTPPLPRFHRLS